MGLGCAKILSSPYGSQAPSPPTLLSLEGHLRPAFTRDTRWKPIHVFLRACNNPGWAQSVGVGRVSRARVDRHRHPTTYLHQILLFFLSWADSFSDRLQFRQDGFGFTKFIPALASWHLFINSVKRGGGEGKEAFYKMVSAEEPLGSVPS